MDFDGQKVLHTERSDCEALTIAQINLEDIPLDILFVLSLGKDNGILFGQNKVIADSITFYAIQCVTPNTADDPDCLEGGLSRVSKLEIWLSFT